MGLEPKFETIIVKSAKKEFNERIKAECKTDCESAGVKKVLSLSARVFGVEKEIAETGVKYGGKIVFYFCYIDESGAVRKVECANEFVGVMKCDEVVNSSAVRVQVFVDKVEWDVSGASVVFVATLGAKIQVENSENKTILTGGDGLILNKKECSYYKSFGLKKAVCPVETEFELNYPVLEVLSQQVSAVITQVQAGVNCIIVDGEVFLSALLLPNRPKSDIIRENKSAGFRFEIECDEAVPKMNAEASVLVKSFKTEVSVDAEKEKSTVNASVSLQLEGECFTVETISATVDAFSVEKELELKKDNYSCYKPVGVMALPCKISGRCEVEELPVSARVTACVGEKVEVTALSALEDKTKIEGVLSMRVFFKDGDGLDFTRVLETPFERELALSLSGCSSPEISVIPSVVGAKIASQNELEIFAETTVSACAYNCLSGEFVCEVVAKEDKVSCDKAVSVYLAGKNEDLWSLAKRLNEKPEEILTGNKDLQFPLSGDERIVVYRQK